MWCVGGGVVGWLLFVEGAVVCEIVHFGKYGRSKVREDRGVLQARVHAVVAV